MTFVQLERPVIQPFVRLITLNTLTSSQNQGKWNHHTRIIFNNIHLSFCKRHETFTLCSCKQPFHYKPIIIPNTTNTVFEVERWPSLSFSCFLVTGKFAFFKAIVIGDPKPSVSWSRNNGDVSDTSRYQTKYDPNSNEHTFEASDTSYQITVTWKGSMRIWGSGKNSNEKRDKYKRRGGGTRSY